MWSSVASRRFLIDTTQFPMVARKLANNEIIHTTTMRKSCEGTRIENTMGRTTTMMADATSIDNVTTCTAFQADGIGFPMCIPILHVRATGVTTIVELPSAGLCELGGVTEVVT